MYNPMLMSVVKHKAFLPVLTGVASFAAGAGAGYFLGKRNAENSRGDISIKEGDIVAEEEFDHPTLEFDAGELVAAARGEAPPKVVIDAEDLEDDKDEERNTSFEETVIEVMGSESDEPDEVTVDGPEPQDEDPSKRHNVFAQSGHDWDYDAELAARTSNEPYILHHEEFHSEESGYTQQTLCYYQGDNQVTDEQDSPVYNFPTILGDLRFGHGSGDPNVVYIRNDKLRAEYEVLLHSGSYAKEVLGIEQEEELDEPLQPRRMRHQEE